MQATSKTQNPIRSAYYAAILAIIAVAIVLPLAAYGLLAAGLMVLLFSPNNSDKVKQKPYSRTVLRAIAGTSLALVSYTCWLDFGLDGIAVVGLLALAGWLLARK